MLPVWCSSPYPPHGHFQTWALAPSRTPPLSRVLKSSSFRTGKETLEKIHLILQHVPKWQVSLPLTFPFSRTSRNVISDARKQEDVAWQDRQLPSLTALYCKRGMLNSDCQPLVPDASLKSIYVLDHYSNNLVFWGKRPNKAIIQMDHDRNIKKAYLGVNHS